MGNTIKTELITNFIKENNLSKAAFCKLCKISTGTLNRVLADNNALRISALFKIAKAIKIKLHELF